MKLNRDKLANADRKVVARSSIGVLNGMQKYPAAVQPLGMAAAFIILCRELRLEAQDVFTMASNIMLTHNRDAMHAEFKAVQAYIVNEVIKNGR